jgi:hypothetical protein
LTHSLILLSINSTSALDGTLQWLVGSGGVASDNQALSIPLERRPGSKRPRLLTSILASIEKLRRDAAEAKLISDLATDMNKREMFARLHQHLSKLADEVETAMKTANA